MIITLAAPGSPRCQVGDFTLLVNPTSDRKGGLILKTQNPIPINTFTDNEVVGGPGEYEISGVRIKGIELSNETSEKAIATAFTTELDGIHMAFIVGISADLTKEELDALGTTDILFLGVDSGKIGEKQVLSFIKQVDPKIVIPTDDATAKELAEALGQKISAEEKFVTKKTDLQKDETTGKLVWLKTK